MKTITLTPAQLDTIRNSIESSIQSAITPDEVKSCMDVLNVIGHDAFADEPNDDMDGDFDSAMASAGFGCDEDYGDYGQNDF